MRDLRLGSLRDVPDDQLRSALDSRFRDLERVIMEYRRMLGRMSIILDSAPTASDVLTWDNTENRAVWTPAAPGGAAPAGAEYLVSAANATLTAEKVFQSGTNTTFTTAATTAQVDVANASETVRGVAELATSAETAAGLVVQASDTRLSDARTPTSHASTHQNGGSDEVATATAGANAIPKAGAGGTLATGWIPAHGSSLHTGNILPGGANQDMGDAYMDFGDIAAPASPSAGVRRVYLDSTSGKLSVRTSAGTSVSLEEQGGSGTSKVCIVSHSTTRTVTSEAALEWDTDINDDHGLHDTVTNNSRITVDTTGYYLITTCNVYGPDGDRIVVRARVNATKDVGQYSEGSSLNATKGGYFAVLTHLTANDYVEIYALSTGTGLVIQGPQGDLPHFGVALVG